jgi:hypothetical protein
MRPACQRVMCVGVLAARIVLGLLYPRRLQKTYHAAGGGCRNRACQVRSWSFEGAGLDLDTGGKLSRLHIRVHLWSVVVGISMGPSVVGRYWSPASSNKARGYCCRTSGDHRAPLQPGRAARRYLRVCWCIASRLPGVRGRAGAGAAGASYPGMPAAALVLYAFRRGCLCVARLKAHVLQLQPQRW